MIELTPQKRRCKRQLVTTSFENATEGVQRILAFLADENVSPRGARMSFKDNVNSCAKWLAHEQRRDLNSQAFGVLCISVA